MEAKVILSTIIVKSMEESIKFYSEVMGFTIDSQYNPRPGLVITLMKSNGDAMVELIEEKSYKVGFYSIGMEVNDINAAFEELKLQGAKNIREPVRTSVGSCGFLEDPNGVTIAIMQHDEQFKNRHT